MSNPSTIWATLALPANLQAQGMIPFVFTDSATISGDVANFWWNQLSAQLSVHTIGDQTGTDSVNAYYQYDSYWPYLLGGLNAGSALGAVNTAGFSVSSSRGTGVAPSYSVSGDFIGKFSGWNWNGVAPAWCEVAGLNIYVSGVTAGNLGGEMRFFTKQDNGALTEWIKLTNAGQFIPLAQGGAALGGANLGFKQLNLNFTISGTAGAQTINTPTGSFKIAAGQSSATITNNLVTVNSIVLATLQTQDTTALYVRSVVPGAGGFTVNLSAAATAQVTVGFLVINTDS